VHHKLLEWRTCHLQHQQHLLEINWEFPHRFKSCLPRLKKCSTTASLSGGGDGRVVKAID
jgi:hypothetical protein